MECQIRTEKLIDQIVYEVSKYATQQPFLNLNKAFQTFFRDLKNGKVSYPRFKKKRDNAGSFYLGGDIVKFEIKGDKQYLKVPNLGSVKMRESLRFKGKINSASISQKADKFYASFSIECEASEYENTHKKALNSQNGIGIDVGLKSFVCLSNGLEINAPKPLAKLTRRLKRVSRQLSKKIHPKTKGDKTKKSANYLKKSVRLGKLHSKIANIRSDFLHKLTSNLVRHYAYFGVENLNVKGMMKNHRLAKAINDVSFYEFKRMLKYKSQYNKRQVIEADKFYPSSKTCSKCGFKKPTLTLRERVFVCEACGFTLDRDLNASLNLLLLAEQKIGLVQAKLTPEDLTALLDDLAINNLVTSKVETGTQQKSYL